MELRVQRMWPKQLTGPGIELVEENVTQTQLTGLGIKMYSCVCETENWQTREWKYVALYMTQTADWTGYGGVCEREYDPDKLTSHCVTLNQQQ